jgi:hypothetical protein
MTHKKENKKGKGTLVRKPSGMRQGRKPAFRNPCFKFNVLETELTFYTCLYTCSPHCCVLGASDNRNYRPSFVTPARLCFEYTQCREDEEVAAIVGVYRICTSEARDGHWRLQWRENNYTRETSR